MSQESGIIDSGYQTPRNIWAVRQAKYSSDTWSSKERKNEIYNRVRVEIRRRNLPLSLSPVMVIMLLILLMLRMSLTLIS